VKNSRIVKEEKNLFLDLFFHPLIQNSMDVDQMTKHALKRKKMGK